MTSKPRKKRAIPRPSFFITTVPVIRPCQACGCWLAAGISEGLHVQADLTQLSPRQAILAIVAGMQLYSMTRTGLVWLDRYRITDPKFTGRLPEHRCGVVWPHEVEGAGQPKQWAVDEIPPY